MITNSTVNVREHRFSHIPYQTKNNDFKVKLELFKFMSKRVNLIKMEQPNHANQLWNTFKHSPRLTIRQMYFCSSHFIVACNTLFASLK